MFGNKSAVLKNILRPETVVALENVSFNMRAEALPGVLEASESIDEVLLTGDNPDEETIDVARTMRCTPDTEERMVVLERYVVAGGLVYDQDSEHLNPCEPGSANGNIYHVSTRRGDADEQRSYYAALGLDSDGNKDFNCQPVCRIQASYTFSCRPRLKHQDRGHYTGCQPQASVHFSHFIFQFLRFADLLLQAIKCRLQDLLLPPGIAPAQSQEKIGKYLHIFRKQWAAFFFFIQSILPGFSQRLLGCQSFGAFLQNICKPAGFL